MSKTALAFIISGSDKKTISKQRTLLTRIVKRSDQHVSKMLESVTEAESLGLELNSSAIAQFFEAVLSSHAQLVAFESPARLSADAMTVDVVVVQLEHVGVQVLFAKSTATKQSDGKIRQALKMALSTEKIFRQARIKIGRQANATAGGRHGGEIQGMELFQGKRASCTE